MSTALQTIEPDEPTATANPHPPTPTRNAEPSPQVLGLSGTMAGSTTLGDAEAGTGTVFRPTLDTPTY